MQNLFRNRNNRYNKKLSSYNMYNNILEFILVVLPTRLHPLPMRFFYFFIFQFRFLQKYIFVFEIYKNIPRPPRCRAAGAFLQKVSGKICARAPGGPVARQRGGRPPRPPGSGAAGSGRPAAGRPPPISF